MGINYYRQRLPTKIEREKLHKMLDELIDGKIPKYEFKETMSNIFERIHICKMSYGWQVLFDHNEGRYYQPCRKELKEFLDAPNTIIEDEYEGRLTSDEFWDVVRSHNESVTNTHTSKTDCSYYDRLHCQNLFKINPTKTDFVIDGLRFAVFSDFS